MDSASTRELQDSLPQHFTLFERDVSQLPLPASFTYPFCYEPHPLSIVAAEELQSYITMQTEWQHDFGDEKDHESFSVGKMFGVLVVKDAQDRLGYLSAFSGKLADSNHHSRFVPPVFDMLREGDFFLEGMKAFNVIQDEVKRLEANPDYQCCLSKQRSDLKQGIEEVKTHKAKIKKEKAERRILRNAAKLTHTAANYKKLEADLAEESLQGRVMLKRIRKYWNELNESNLADLAVYKDEIDACKARRAAHSANLQRRLFDSYKFLNAKGEVATLNDIFKNLPSKAGAGECAAPKLLHYALKHKLKPIALAEFWWGSSPKNNERKHKAYYPACKNKCRPILEFMLEDFELFNTRNES